MKEKEVNQIIAEYMIDPYFCNHCDNDGGDCDYCENIYTQSLDSLLPVVEKLKDKFFFVLTTYEFSQVETRRWVGYDNEHFDLVQTNDKVDLVTAFATAVARAIQESNKNE